ncbi:MAG: hypothetical protein M0R80_00360 [Proteobacteria bacterium]|jgi:hypothetical protein|nr:hypothetical protein [Pseudomonadota bacterium]
MDDETRPDGIALTIVGGQPLRKGRRHAPQGKLEIPVGLERILYLAAGDPELRARLLADRAGVIAAMGVALRPSEKAMLEAAPGAALEAMIDRIDTSNPRRRRFMNLVAAAATALAAGTAGTACDWVDDPTMNYADGGVGPDTETDTDDADPDAGTDLDAGALKASRSEVKR